MGSHDHQIGVHLDRDVVDVVEQMANAYRRFHVTVEFGGMLLSKGPKAVFGLSKFAFLAHNVKQMQFTFQGLSHSNGVVHRIGGYRGEVHRDENAVL